MATGVAISKRLVLINSASSIVAKIVNASVLVWLHQYLLRRISPEEYALYPTVMAIMVFVPLLTTVMTGGLGRYIVEAYAKGDERRVTQIASTMFPPLMVAGMVVLAVGMTLAWQVDHILTIAPERVRDAQFMLVLLSTGAAARLPMLPFSFGLYVRQQFVLDNALALGQEVLRTAVLFVLLFGVSTRVLWVVIASVSAEFSRLVVTQVISRRMVPCLRWNRGDFQWDLAKELSSFGLWTFTSSVADMIYNNAAPLILNKLGSALDVACFNLGVLVANQIQGLWLLISAPLQPAITAMHAEGSKDRLRNVYLRGARYSLWSLLAVILPLMIYRREVMLLYAGPKYLASATVMLLLLAQFPFGYVNIMMGKLAIATAQLGSPARRILFIQLVSLGLSLYLVGRLHMGAVGSALGNLSAVMILHPLLMWPLGLRLAGVSVSTWMREAVVPGFMPGVVAACVWLALRSAAAPGSWLMLGVFTACGGLVYLVVLLRFSCGPYEKAHFQMLKATLLAQVNRVRSAGRRSP